MVKRRTIPRAAVAAGRVIGSEAVAVGLFILVSRIELGSGPEASIVKGVAAVICGSVVGLVLLVVGLRRWQGADAIAVAPLSAAAMATVATGDLHYLVWAGAASPILAALVVHRTVRQTRGM